MQFRSVARGFKFMEAGRVDSCGRVLFSDYARGGLYRLSPDGSIETFLLQVTGIGGLAFNDDGRLVTSGADGMWIFDPTNGRRHCLLTEVDGRKCSMNDIEADGFGGVYGGTIDLAARASGRTAEYGALFHLSTKGRLTVLHEGVGASNGIALSPDRRTLYHSDTGTGVWAHELADPSAPSKVINSRLLVALEDSDGIKVDSNGELWVAGWSSGAILRFAADGSPRGRYPLPEGQAMTLAFGGADLRDLYVFSGANVRDPSAAATASLFLAHSDAAGQADATTAFPQ